MQRFKLFSGMIALTALIAAVVIWGSPYAPVVQPCPESIEEIWAIEDARTESVQPLVTALENNGIPLAYDAQENTFYCTLGMGNDENWPQIHLHAPGADGVSLVFVDDYAYDFCSDAIRDGYAYQVMAYTDTEFAYFDIVFTGMRQIHMSTQAQLTMEDVPAYVAVLNEKGVLKSDVRTHYRGAGTTEFPKRGIRIEFTRDSDGTHKIEREVPEIGLTKNLVLLPMYSDDALMRDKICWMMYDDLTDDGEAFGSRPMQYVELFVNQRYEGIYLMMDPYDNEKEIAGYSASGLSTDSIYRVSRLHYGTERPTLPGVYEESREFELYHTPPGAKPFADLKDYIDLCLEENDESFVHKALECMDLDSMIRYTLLFHAAGLTDNAFNNLNIWACHEESGVKYRYFPWDLDNSFGLYPSHLGSEYDQWMYLPLADRMINLNVGNIRERLLEKWKALREDAWTLEKLEERVNRCASELNDSGAAARNAQRWNHEWHVVDGYKLIAFAGMRFAVLDTVFEKIAQYDGKLEMLDYTDYENRSCPLAQWLES